MDLPLAVDRSLCGDTYVFSDTLAPTLVYIFYELALEHKRAALIREELKNVDIRKHRALEACRYLNGVINETLRLHPPVPTHGYRQTPPEGIMVAGTFIPGGTTIVAPRYSFGRCKATIILISDDVLYATLMTYS